MAEPSLRKDALASSTRLLIASLNPSSVLLVLSIVIVEEADDPITIVTAPDEIDVVVSAYPPVMSLLSVARLLTMRE